MTVSTCQFHKNVIYFIHRSPTLSVNHSSPLSIVERMEEFSGDFHNIKNSKNYQNQITNPAEPKNEQLAEIQYRALLKTQLQDLLEKSEQATQDLGNFRSALEANQLRQKLSGTAIQA